MNIQHTYINQEREDIISKLISKMTIEEKIGQLTQIGPSPVGGFEVSKQEQKELLKQGIITQQQYDDFLCNTKWDEREEDVRKGTAGSFLGLCDVDRCNHMQRVAVEQSRLGIPLLFGLDVIHGHRTVFPIPLAQSCTFDDELIEQGARVAASEASSEGIAWTFAPMVDVARDARWGRVAESPGEDTYLACRYATSMVKGFQGKDLSAADSILACAKHFVAYGAGIGGRDYNTSDMSLQTLWETYLPPFKAACEAGVGTVMTAFEDLNGIPCSVNKYLLKTVLRNALAFKGFVVSDACSIAECVAHGVVADRKEAAQEALKAGLNLDMGCGCYSDHLKELLAEGQVSMDEVDNAVREILRMKMIKGLFDHPYVDPSRKDKVILCKKNRELARQSARKSIVLLKNDNVLPLSPKMKIAIVGELADNALEMLGTWVLSGKAEDATSLLQGLKNRDIAVKYATCCGVETALNRKELEKTIQDADVVLATVGEYKDMSGEASSLCNIDLHGEQKELIKALQDSGKPFVTILFNGRPLAIKEVVERSPAVLECWHLGTEAGNAICDVLFGDYNPSGRLTTTFPNYSGECPLYYNHVNTGRPTSDLRWSVKYMDAPQQPLFPFGYGLSYTQYQYSSLQATVKGNEIVTTVLVENTGKVDGEETVQLYVHDVVASRARPIRQLQAYQKVWLKSGESKKVTLHVKISSLGFYDEEMKYIVESGDFMVFVGHDSSATLSQTVYISASHTTDDKDGM